MECLDSLYDARPPPRWVKISWVSPTSGLWMTSFLERVEQLTVWLTKGRPPAFWLTGFFNPNGFLTATMQEVARKHQGWCDAALTPRLRETIETVLSRERLPQGAGRSSDVHGGDEAGPGGPALWAGRGGVCLRQATTPIPPRFPRAREVRTPNSPSRRVRAGLWIDGAGWDKKRVSLVDQAPKVLFYELPVLWITGVQHTEKKSGWGFAATPGGKIDMTKYSCPLYMYPRRCTGALGTYIDQVDLPCGADPPQKWVLRGVCLLCTSASPSYSYPTEPRLVRS